MKINLLSQTHFYIIFLKSGVPSEFYGFGGAMIVIESLYIVRLYNALGKNLGIAVSEMYLYLNPSSLI